jgi:hypothetical protein
MKTLLILILISTLTGCADLPLRLSVSGDIQAEGMKTPLRLEIGYWNVRMTGKEVRPVQ